MTSRGLPKTVQVYHREWKVFLRSGLDAQGECNTELREIYINPEYPIEEQRATLFHETLHAVLFEGGISKALPGELEEAVVTCIENGLFPQVGFVKK